MNRRHVLSALPVLGVVFIISGLCGFAASAETGALTPESRRLLSRLQAMSHGHYPASEWSAIIESIHQSIERAEQAGDETEMIEITLILADVHSEMLGNHRRALIELNDLRTYFDGRDVEGMPRIYAGLAEVNARMGDEAAILVLIEEFKASSYYDPRTHTIEGGEGPASPVAIMRPKAGGDDSLTVTMMRRSAREARLAVGRMFPEFEIYDAAGRPVRLSDYRGRVVLLDFWVRGWRSWSERLPGTVDLYRRRHGEGFDVLGICIEPRPEGLQAFAAEHGMTWTLVADTTLSSRLGIMGSATSFVLDRDGKIVGKDLSSGELAAAVSRLLASEQ